MLSDLENLLSLQDVDREILRLKEEIAALPKRVAAIEAQLAGTKASLEEAKAAVKSDEAARKKYEASILDLQQKISKYRDQQLDVKTNEQYKALVHEIEFAQQGIRGNEDKILELMEKAEAREKDVKAAEAELKAETAEIEKEKKIAHDKTAEDEKALQELNAKRDELRKQVEPDMLEHYERVARARKTGIAEVSREGKCMACQVMLRPQIFAEVRAGQKLIACESCSRILYYKPQPVVAEAVAKKKRPRPKADAPQAWFYRAEYGELGEALLLFENADDASTRRVFDWHTGRLQGAIENRPGTYVSAFAEDLAGAVRLNGVLSPAELAEYGGELPMIALDPLHRDLLAAQAETRSTEEIAS